jgi:hypothetical protein
MQETTTHPGEMPKRLLASASMDGTVQIWSLHGQTTSLLSQWDEHRGEVFALACSPDGIFIASSGKDTTVRIWHTLSGELACTYTGHSEAVYTLAWSPDGKLLASGGRDRTVQIWDAHTGEQLLSYRGHTHAVTSVAWSPDGRRIVSGGSGGTWQIWDAASGARRPISSHPSLGAIYALAWSPDGTMLALAGWGITVMSRGAEMEKEAPSLRLLDEEIWGTEDIYALAWSPDGTRLAGGGFRGQVRIWEARTGRCLRSYWGQQEYVRALAWSPDGKLLASGGWDGTVQVWDASTGRKLASYEGHKRPISAVVWLPLMPQDDVLVALSGEHAGAAARNGARPVQQPRGADRSVFPPLYARISHTPPASASGIAPPVRKGVPDREQRRPGERHATTAASVSGAVTGSAEDGAPKEGVLPVPVQNDIWTPPAWPASILFALSPPGLLLLLLLLALASFGTGMFLLLLSPLLHIPPFFLHLLLD